ncbi:unnamed protein product, partial [marine sediment metagenome]
MRQLLGDIVLVEGYNELNVQMTPIPPPVAWANITLSVVDADTKAHLSGVELRIDHENGAWARNLNFSSPQSYDGELCGFTAGTITIT